MCYVLFHVISCHFTWLDVFWCYSLMLFHVYIFCFSAPFFYQRRGHGGCSDLEVLQLCSSASWERGVSPIPPNGEGKGKSSTQTCRLSGDMLVPRRVSLCVGWVVSAKPVWKILFRKGRKDGRIIYCKSEWNGWVGKCRKNLRSLPIQTSLWVSLDRISCSSVHCLLVVYDVGDFLF